MTSSDDETGPEGSRHRSSEPRISRWRRRHEDDEVGELDPDEVAELLRRTAQADRDSVDEGGSDTVQRAEDGDTAARRVFSDALEIGLADPTPPDKRHLLPRRRHEGERPVVAAAAGDGHHDPETLLRAAHQRIEEYAAKLRHTREDLAAAEERARALTDELAARDAEYGERTTALSTERDGIEERVRALTQAVEGAAEERATLERVVADQARMLEEAQLELSRSREEIDRTAEQLRQTEADLEQAEQRSRTLATETAARATEHSERVRALVAEREAAEERARALAAEVSASASGHDELNQRAAQERESLEQALAKAVRLAEEASAARAKAETTAAEYAARLEEAGSGSTESDDEIAALKGDLAAAEARIRALNEEAAERNALHAERVDALLTDAAAAEHAAEEARRVAQQAEAKMFEVRAEAQRTVEQRTAALSEAHQALADAHALAGAQAQARAAAEERVAALERQLDEAHVLPVFSPVEAVTQREAVPVVVEPEQWFEPELEEPEWEEPEAEETEPEPEVEETEPEPEVEEPQVEEPEWEEPEAEEPRVEEREPEPASTRVARTAPATYDSKRGSGPIGVLAGLIALVCAAAVGWLAYQGTMLDRVNLSIGLTVGAMLALGVALRRRAQSSEVHLDRGTLRLRFGDNQHTFYLNSPSTQLQMTGQPGDRDWRMQVLRRGMAPVTIDAKDVDPVAFTEALHQWRPSG